jgi:hypothetical protein
MHRVTGNVTDRAAVRGQLQHPQQQHQRTDPRTSASATVTAAITVQTLTAVHHATPARSAAIRSASSGPSMTSQ